jgi:hypothetical protein
MRRCGSPDVVFFLQVIVDVSVEKLDGLYRHNIKNFGPSSSIYDRLAKQCLRRLKGSFWLRVKTGVCLVQESRTGRVISPPYRSVPSVSG